MTLVIALPGLKVQPEDFKTHGFAAALKSKASAELRPLPFSPIDYLDRDFPHHLRAQIPEGRVVILALSSGALGALRFVRHYEEAIAGLILLAPFLANPGTIAEIERAGGLAAWRPPPLESSDIERPGLLWLKSYGMVRGQRPWIHLGFGTGDRFAAGARLLAATLPESAVTSGPGGHDWQTWTRLWDAMLDRLPLDKDKP